ncbi:MAG: Deoxyguanosinetriphosphate triphosphohydrolase [Candidatus Uhrbacteria bacterium GW2011_GWF2_41_16]|uniref:Deoxyguanosinetriphosphate triphosphohydrolase n=2 Tax=Candidatus Uhriibacteriota TaxID=1752732 RepID=A0A0G0YEN2_9BACT|nr:MAG: Deoxyguanosinetriphosphate triphosphohydrolase [Candidatus Uhrbacteria bacterium GW2011_GWA2_41_10]KKR87848.1 MAG: Deoxyguanosinetriphosphate triphosphohydrolase [Candidatus Uhrbacteria bacterium GW2011_GWC2_41_11]KKR98787.1 MAG: Deoxyguanosinetriphosphate triphosphohydrolase [Candidatus Uhrbacteria bacterium GW2011_GWF2_41_16]
MSHRYHDFLYREMHVSDFIWELLHTPQVQRLHGISQDVLPSGLLPWNMPSRLEHGMGVVRLATEVIKNNPSFAPYENLLLGAALLHDAGNASLSHLNEPFLKVIMGKDGESFLEEILHQSEAAEVLNHFGCSPEQVVRFVTGEAAPLSRVLNGSMDIDNLDNIHRYWMISNKQPLFDPILLASSFRFCDGKWMLDANMHPESRKWQKAREAVYAVIYGEPHLNTAKMLERAIWFAFEQGELSEAYFRMNDQEAVEYLQSCNEKTAFLANRVSTRDLYALCFAFETTKPSEKFLALSQKWDARYEVADAIAAHIKMPREAVCVHLGKGRDRRKIDLPFVRDDGSFFMDNSPPECLEPIYRIKVYLDGEVHRHTIAVHDMVKTWIMS